MKEIIEATSMALQATTQIQDWSNKILQKIESKLKNEYEKAVTIDYITYPSGSSPLSFPHWAGQLVGPKEFEWGARDFPKQNTFGYYMISFRKKSGDPQWRPYIFWGVMKDVERRGGRFDIRTIAKELLDLINKIREPGTEMTTQRAQGSWSLEKRDFFDFLDNQKIERLSEDISQTFQEELLKGRE